MQHGSMKKLCRRKTHKYLSIWKKIEAENARLHFWAARFWNHISKFMFAYVDIHDKIIVQHDGLGVVKGAHSWVNKLTRT
jgi:hypothetical protein